MPRTSDPTPQRRAALTPPATIASRLDASRMDTVGARGYLDELLASFDSTLVRLKLRVAFSTGLLFGILAAMTYVPGVTFALSPPGWGWLLVAAGILAFAWMTGVLTRVTFAELSRLRPGRWDDLREGGLGLVIRLALLIGFYLLSILGLLALSHATADWLVASTELAYRDEYLNGLQAATVLVLTLSLVMVPLLLPLASILVVERCSFHSGLFQWFRLVRQYGGQLVFAETLAITFAALLTLPLVGIAAIVAWAYPPGANGWMPCVLGGLAAAVPIAYVLVANVFIYLKLRYETPNHRA